MDKVIIRNIGPINDVELNLNKVNIIMGPQSSGKSTIVKIISYCQWVEKRFILDGEYNDTFVEQFIKFHRISESYFSNESLIIYESDYIKITYTGIKHTQRIRRKAKNIKYLKSKNIYIPAERNFVSVIPNLGKYKETNDNIMSFLYEWYDTKKKYSKGKSLPILNLNVDYHHIEDSDNDIITLKSIDKEISLRNASSGLQSVVPLTMLIDYLADGFYNENASNSIIELENIKSVLIKNINEIFKIERLNEIQFNIDAAKGPKLSKKESQRIINLVNSRTKYHYSNFIIEEPEQNLFPETQRDLIYFLINKITKTGRDHRLTLTTHSPYILYAINNCMMGMRVSDNMPSEIKDELLSKDSWINPDDVSIWEIENGKGTLKSIKDKETGTVSKHYFNKIMNDVMDEYYEMLSYLEI